MNLNTLLFWILVIEAITIILRFSFKLEARNYQKKWHFRIHHAYIGIVLFFFGFFKEFSLALIISDAIHHFIVLPLAVGKTEFP